MISNDFNSFISILGALSDSMTYDYGGGIYCLDCKSFYLLNSSISNARAYDGGCLFLSQTESKKLYDSTDAAYYVVRLFPNNCIDFLIYIQQM